VLEKSNVNKGSTSRMHRLRLRKRAFDGLHMFYETELLTNSLAVAGPLLSQRVSRSGRNTSTQYLKDSAD